ncbi:MAG: DUF4359 domain-containing protein [Bacteroidaceae bacterium]|nr:DUF4359 domain-containing protein [Bacteroidaceae bacterium]
METSKTNSKGFKATIVVLLVVSILLAVGIAAVALNPNEQAHQEAVSTNVSKAVSASFQKQTNNLLGEKFPSVEKLVEKASEPVIESLTKTIIQNQLDYHDYVVFSTTTFTVPEMVSKFTEKNKEKELEGDVVKTVSVGAFGKVFTADKQEIENSIDGYVGDFIEKTNFIEQFFDSESETGSEIEQIFGDTDLSEKIEAGAKILNKIIENVIDD